MFITSHRGQVTAGGLPEAGANIDSLFSGQAAIIQFWSGSTYLVRVPGHPHARVVILPCDDWLKDVEEAGMEIVGRLEDLMEKPCAGGGTEERGAM